MYGNEGLAKQVAMMAQTTGQIIGAGQDIRHNPTLAQSIDHRVAMLEQQIDRLNRVKSLLAEPAGILNVPVDDLRFAMSY